MLPPQIIFGYHGCDESLAKIIFHTVCGSIQSASPEGWHNRSRG